MIALTNLLYKHRVRADFHLLQYLLAHLLYLVTAVCRRPDHPVHSVHTCLMLAVNEARCRRNRMSYNTLTWHNTDRASDSINKLHFNTNTSLDSHETQFTVNLKNNL